MRVIHPLLTCLSILFLFSNNVFSQSSSIYKDSEELAKFLAIDHFISIQLKKSFDSEASLHLKSEGAKDAKVYNTEKVDLPFGYYDIQVKNWESKDSLNLIFPDTLISFGFNDSLIVQSAKEEWKLNSGALEALSNVKKISNEYFSIYYEAGYLDLYISFEMESGLTTPPSLYYTKDFDIQPYSKLLKILNTHSNFGQVDKGVDLTFQKTQFNYALNPFLNNIANGNPLLSSEIDNYFPSNFYLNTNKDFANYYYKNNPWHKLLYGDSLLNFQKMVSFKDASTSYRTRIVTSQNELTNASIRINETNKRKNLLDAKTVAVGLSDFIAERAQEELNLTFFNRFKENLEQPSELTVLFPNTKNLLYQFEISNYKTLLSHARESFKVDLENLGLNFPEILKLEKYQDFYNSPEVFNLSLIYSIADLAYKEEPVENILIASYQKLRDRKKELKKSINIELADSFIDAVKPKDVKNYKIKAKEVSRSEELQKMKKQVNEYIEAVHQARNIISDNSSALRNQYYDDTQIDSITKNQLFEKLNLKTEGRKNSFYRKIQYNNRTISSTYILDHYRKIINANLDGKPYYGYLMGQPHLEDYQLYFKTPLDSINSIIAEGIEGSRHLMEENFEEMLNDSYHFLQNSSAEYRAITKKEIIKKEAELGPDKKILNFVDQVKLLQSAIDQEITFWENLTQLDQTDHQIAGLYFLKALIELDQQINLFMWVAFDLSTGADYHKLVEDFYSKSLGDDFEKNMQLATNQLDSIHAVFEDKINSLVDEYGHINYQDSVYQHQILDTQIHNDTTKFNSESLGKMIVFDRQINFLEGILGGRSKNRTERDILIYETAAPELANTAKTVLANLDELFLLRDQIKALNDQLININDSVEKEKINTQINQLTEQVDLIFEKNENLINEHLEKINTLKNTQLAEVTPQKKALLEKLKVKKDSLNNINFTSSRPLRQIYSLDNNYSFKKYIHAKENVNSINFYERKEMKVINEFDEKLVKTKLVLDTLISKRTQLENNFIRLDTTFCKGLVEAQQNASNLAKSLEFSTHLLFAFRDYDRIYDPVFVYDSSYLQVTVSQLDTLTGFTNTITRDSLVIKKDTIDGTTKPLVAARWITRKEFDELRNNPTQWNIFLGLLYQRLNSIEDAPNFSAEGVALLATKFLSITHDMDTYRSNLRRKKATTPDLITFKDYYPFIRSTIDLFNTVITTPSIGDSTATVLNKFKLQNIPQISNEALSLYENIYVKEYGNAVLNAMELLKIISNKKLGKKEARKSQRSINAVLTYGTFMANMINAQSSDQVKNILKSATLPPGSSRIKRETVSSFTINSYLGAAIGRDRLLGVPENLDLAQDAFGASLSVPIGFTYSFSPNLIKNNSSFSIHVPLIDLGAITAYRQNPKNTNYSIDDLPDFSWQNLFSPGAFVVYNFANSPFSLGVGGQYGPQLRQITPTGGEAINLNSWRFPMAFFTIDVPFFNLHTGARKIIVN